MSYTASGSSAAVGEETAQAILSVVEPYKDALGIVDLRLTPTEDHDGDPVIYAYLKHRLVKPRLSSRSLWAMEREMRAAARQRGESRFVHVRHDFANEQILDHNQ